MARRPATELDRGGDELRTLHTACASLRGNLTALQRDYSVLQQQLAKSEADLRLRTNQGKALFKRLECERAQRTRAEATIVTLSHRLAELEDRDRIDELNANYGRDEALADASSEQGDADDV